MTSGHKWIIGVLISALLSLDAFASNADLAKTILIAGGTTYGLAHVQYRMLLRRELEDWKDPETKSTAHLDRQCGMNWEFRLVSTHRKNYLYIAAVNSSQRSVVMDPARVKFRFGDGHERYGAWEFPVQPNEIKPQWNVRGLIPFPSKEDFKKQKSLAVLIPLSTTDGKPQCTVETLITRPEIEEDPASYTARTVFDFTFGLGQSFTRTHTLKQLAERPTLIEFSMYVYPWYRHGFFLGFMGEGVSNDGFALISNELGNLDSSSARFFGGVLGYSYRSYLTDHFQASYDVGLGGMAFVFPDKSDPQDAGNSFLFHQRITIDYRILRSFHWFWGSDLFLGISLYHNWMDGEVGDFNILGHGAGAMIRLRWGG